MRIVGSVFTIIVLMVIGFGSLALAQYGYAYGPRWLCRAHVDGVDTGSPFLILATMSVMLISGVGVVAVIVNTKWSDK